MHDRLGIIVAVVSCYLVQCGFCDRDLFPEGFQLGYRWRATTHVGTVFPSEHLTKYSLDAYFSVQTYQNVTTFQIKEFKTTEVQLEFPWITLPFRCSYKDGEVQTFERESADVLGSLNIKRALAGMLQLKLGSPWRSSFITEEAGVYGKCNVQYLVTKENNNTNVKKIVNFSACDNKLGQQWSNTPAFTCPSNYQNGSMSHSVRTYILDEANTIQYLNVIGTVEFQPFQALAESHHIFVNQTIDLEEMFPITDAITLEAKLDDSIEYDFNHYEDPTLGYKSSNKSQLLTEIHDILGQLTESLSWELGTTDLDNQTEFRALELMWWLDTSDWKTLYDTIKFGTSYSQETIQQFFWDLVPQVGSASSVAFIRELIKTQEVTGFLATGLLITFPYHVRYPNEKLLKESELLLYLDKPIIEVRKVAILSFASLVHKTCSHGMCSEDTQNHFIRLFLDRFKKSTTHNEQMLYIEAFSNMKINNILEFLQPIITDHGRNRHIRLVAIWATKSATTDHPEKVAEVFWPILMNRSEPVEIRTSALNMLMMSQPTVSRFLTLYWFMQTESSQQIYNFYYTTINSIANSKYPCYNKYRRIASQIVRFVQHKWHHWATGNYLLDYEDPLRGYGGIVQTVLVANQRTGLPSLFRLTGEQHSFGMSSEFEVHVKAEGFADDLKKLLIGAMVKPSDESVDVPKLLEVLKMAKFKILNDEDLHFETIIKINGQTIYCHHLNRTTFNTFAEDFRKLSSLYYQFSVNYQRLSFPLRFQQTQFTDFGTPILLQFRTASLLSLRGSIKQTENGNSRDAELDFRYSMNTVTSLKTFNPLSNTWRGADRLRCIHARIPFSTEIITHFYRSYVKASAYRYKKFVDGSRLGVVWHSATKLFPVENTTPPTIEKDELPLTDDWAFESRDLGAKIATTVFDCQDEGKFSNSLMIIKEAFQISNKNYQSIPGGVAFLGIYSLSNYFTFIPPEDSCGLILSISPLQVVPVFIQENNTVHVTMNHYDQILWGLNARYSRIDDGNQEISFKLVHSDRERNITVTNGYWRLLRFEGSFILPSRKSGALHAPPPLHGNATVSWGYHDSATTMVMSIEPANPNEAWPEQCVIDSPTCLQTASDISTSQIIALQFVNLPSWMIITMHSLFPDFVIDNGNKTTVKFTFPTKLPWTTRGICAVNSKTALTLDNSTMHNFKLDQDCYTVALADCSPSARFVVGIKMNTSNSTLNVRVSSQNSIIDIIQDNSNIKIYVNGTEIEVSPIGVEYPLKNKDDGFLFRAKKWDKEMTDIEINTGITVQHYGHTVVVLVESEWRGFTCGLCGNFNSENSDELNVPPRCIQL